MWVVVKFSDESITPGYVSSEFLGDTKEGIDVLRAYTKKTGAPSALRYMPWVVSVENGQRQLGQQRGPKGGPDQF